MSPLPLLLLAVLLATTSSKIFQFDKLQAKEEKQESELHQRQGLVQEKGQEQGPHQEKVQEKLQEQEQEQEQEQDVHPLVSWHAWQALSLVGVTGTPANGFLLHTFYRFSLRQ